MEEIDKIKPSEDTLMTDHLIRIFKSAGCSPTECHACGEEIKSGDIFKLVPHPKRNGSGTYQDEVIDEMCCSKCSSHELTLRDRRYRRASKNHRVAKIAGGGHGFSRPSKGKQ